jgi:hypothetical protein
MKRKMKTISKSKSTKGKGNRNQPKSLKFWNFKIVCMEFLNSQFIPSKFENNPFLINIVKFVSFSKCKIAGSMGKVRFFKIMRTFETPNNCFVAFLFLSGYRDSKQCATL